MMSLSLVLAAFSLVSLLLCLVLCVHRSSKRQSSRGLWVECPDDVNQQPVLNHIFSSESTDNRCASTAVCPSVHQDSLALARDSREGVGHFAPSDRANSSGISHGKSPDDAPGDQILRTFTVTRQQNQASNIAVTFPQEDHCVKGEKLDLNNSADVGEKSRGAPDHYHTGLKVNLGEKYDANKTNPSADVEDDEKSRDSLCDDGYQVVDMAQKIPQDHSSHDPKGQGIVYPVRRSSIEDDYQPIDIDNQAGITSRREGGNRMTETSSLYAVVSLASECDVGQGNPSTDVENRDGDIAGEENDRNYSVVHKNKSNKPKASTQTRESLLDDYYSSIDISNTALPTVNNPVKGANIDNIHGVVGSHDRDSDDYYQAVDMAPELLLNHSTHGSDGGIACSDRRNSIEDDYQPIEVAGHACITPRQEGQNRMPSLYATVNVGNDLEDEGTDKEIYQVVEDPPGHGAGDIRTSADRGSRPTDGEAHKAVDFTPAYAIVNSGGNPRDSISSNNVAEEDYYSSVDVVHVIGDQLPNTESNEAGVTHDSINTTEKCTHIDIERQACYEKRVSDLYSVVNKPPNSRCPEVITVEALNTDAAAGEDDYDRLEPRGIVGKPASADENSNTLSQNKAQGNGREV